MDNFLRQTSTLSLFCFTFTETAKIIIVEFWNFIPYLCVTLKFRSWIEISIKSRNLDQKSKFGSQTQIWIRKWIEISVSDLHTRNQNFGFFQRLVKISDSDQNFDKILANKKEMNKWLQIWIFNFFDFWSKFRFLIQISISDPNFDFW